MMSHFSTFGDTLMVGSTCGRFRSDWQRGGFMDRLRAGQRGTVEKIGLTGPLGRRLTDLGLVEGTRVACRMTAPRGDPLAFELRGTVIALRASDARRILCRLEG